MKQVKYVEIDKSIDDFIQLVESQGYQEFINKNPAGTSWTEYCTEFKENVIESLRGRNLQDVLNLLTQSGAINSPISFADQETAELAISWHVHRVSKNIAIEDYFPTIEESEFIDGNALITLRDGRRFSLDTFRYLAYIEKIESKLISIENCKVYVELGSGNGGFARIIKILSPSAKCILIDLPEILFTSRSFLMMNFPDARHIFIKSSEDLFDVLDSSNADFVYLSHSLFDELPKISKKIDLLCNMRSIGEMPEHMTKVYKLIIDKLYIDNVFLENRFLNPYSKLHRFILNYRKDEITGSTWMGGSWNTVDFQIEPEWTRSPYESDHPRYLSLCLSSIIKAEQGERISTENVLRTIKSQLWYAKYKQLRPWNMAFKPTALDNQTLKDLWELNRKNPTEESLGLMIDFISYHFGSINVEEKDFYIKELKLKFGRSYVPITKISYKQKSIRVLNAIFNQIKKKITRTYNTQVTGKYK